MRQSAMSGFSLTSSILMYPLDGRIVDVCQYFELVEILLHAYDAALLLRFVLRSDLLDPESSQPFPLLLYLGHLLLPVGHEVLSRFLEALIRLLFEGNALPFPHKRSPSSTANRRQGLFALQLPLQPRRRGVLGVEERAISGCGLRYFDRSTQCRRGKHASSKHMRTLCIGGDRDE